MLISKNFILNILNYNHKTKRNAIPIQPHLGQMRTYVLLALVLAWPAAYYCGYVLIGIVIHCHFVIIASVMFQEVPGVVQCKVLPILPARNCMKNEGV